MKFCSDFGSCYRGAGSRSPPPSETGTPSSLPESDGVGYRRRRVARSKSGSSSSSSSSNWRPKLAAISEDGLVRAAEEKDGKREGGGSRKRPAAETRRRGSMGKSHSFGHGDEFIYRQSSSMSMAIPAFSPTPFMF